MRADELTSSSSPRGPGPPPACCARRGRCRARPSTARFPVLASSASRYERRPVIAEQDDEVAVERRRAAVAPLRVERRVLGAEVARPDDAAAPGRARPAGRCRTRRRRARRRSTGVGVARLCFSCSSGNGPARGVRCSHSRLSARPIERLDDERRRSPAAPVDRRRPMAALASGERSIVAREPRAGRRRPRPARARPARSR